tara:strand:- start:199 stop:1182 length:984 start_codon:yes stop_codon:yes gene_type:complete
MKKGFIIKLILTVGIFAVLLSFVGIDKLVTTMKRLNLNYIPLILLLSFLHFFIGTLNLKILISPLSNIPYKTLFKYHALSWAVGTFVPGRLGEFGLVYFLQDHHISIGEGTAITTIDKLITVLTLGLLSMYGLFFFLDPVQASSYLVTLFVGIGAVLFLIFTNLGRSIIIRLMRGFSANFKGFSRTLFYYLREERFILGLNFVLTVIKWLVMTVLIFVLLLAFDVHISFWLVFLANVSTMIISQIPITINGIGLKESVATVLYFRIGVPTFITLSVYIITLIITYLQSTLFISIYTDKPMRTKLLKDTKSLFRSNISFKDKIRPMNP